MFSWVCLLSVIFADGCRPDVNSLCSILDEVAQCNRDTFTLHRHICATDVRPDWPLYTDEDRAALSRFVNYQYFSEFLCHL